MRHLAETIGIVTGLSTQTDHTTIQPYSNPTVSVHKRNLDVRSRDTINTTKRLISISGILKTKNQQRVTE